MSDLEREQRDRAEAMPGPGGVLGAEPPLDAGSELNAAARTSPIARSQWWLFRHRLVRHKGAMISFGVLLVLTIACFGADWFAPYDPNRQDILLGDVPPGADHWLGTDLLGRDQFSRLLVAGQITLKIGFSVAIISTLLGTTIGAIAGYRGGWTDRGLMWFTDLFLVVPQLAILAVIIQRTGRTDIGIIAILSFIFWMATARVVRAQVLSLREKEFVEAARAAGATSKRVIVRHLIPNMFGTIMVNATLAIAAAVVTESTLSFLGFGVDPPATSWGKMLDDAKSAVGTDQSYLLYAPGLAILITVLCVNFIGDGLRDAFDPQEKQHG